MKLNCGPTKAEREMVRSARLIARRQWHKVFVIWPRRVGSHDCRAFETIERRWVFKERAYSMAIMSSYYKYGWEYRACR